MQNKEHPRIRQVDGERIPYDLLLLADETIESINKYIFSSEIYVLEENGTSIAVYAFQRLNADEVEVKNIAVAKDYQRKGIGKTLLRDAAETAKSKGFKRIIIGTGDAATKLLAFYQRQGFTVFGVKKDFFIDNFPAPIFEEGVKLKDMVMLKKEL